MIEFSNKKEIDINIDYKQHLNNDYFKKLREQNPFVFDKENTLEKVLIICGYAHKLFNHNGDNVPEKNDPIFIIEEAIKGKNFRCVEYSSVANALLLSYGIVSRIVSLRTKDVETREYGAGHVVIEFWYTEKQKWVLVEVQEGIVPKNEEGHELSSVEFLFEIQNKKPTTFIPVIDSSMSEQDFIEYKKWIFQYLFYFFIKTKAEDFSGNYDANDKNNFLTLTPIDSTTPKVFQKKIPIYSLETHSVVDFYPIVK